MLDEFWPNLGPKTGPKSAEIPARLQCKIRRGYGPTRECSHLCQPDAAWAALGPSLFLVHKGARPSSHHFYLDKDPAPIEVQAPSETVVDELCLMYLH